MIILIYNTHIVIRELKQSPSSQKQNEKQYIWQADEGWQNIADHFPAETLKRFIISNSLADRTNTHTLSVRVC